MSAEFFWKRWHRGVQMGGKYELEAMEWTDAYKQSPSKNQLDKFNKDWDKLEKSLEDFVNGKKGAVSPWVQSLK